MRTYLTAKVGSSTRGRAIWLLAAVVFLLPSAVWATTVSVDCNAGGSINTALSGLDLQGPHTITVTGTCVEQVDISDRERLTIQAPGGQIATIMSDALDGVPVFIFRWRSIVLRRLVLTGGSAGLFIACSEVQMKIGRAHV